MPRSVTSQEMAGALRDPAVRDLATARLEIRLAAFAAGQTFRARAEGSPHTAAGARRQNVSVTPHFFLLSVSL